MDSHESALDCCRTYAYNKPLARLRLAGAAATLWLVDSLLRLLHMSSRSIAWALSEARRRVQISLQHRRINLPTRGRCIFSQSRRRASARCTTAVHATPLVSVCRRRVGLCAGCRLGRICDRTLSHGASAKLLDHARLPPLTSSSPCLHRAGRSRTHSHVGARAKACIPFPIDTYNQVPSLWQNPLP